MTTEELTLHIALQEKFERSVDHMKKLYFLLLVLCFTSCTEVIHEHHCRIINKVYEEPYSITKYRTTSDGGIIYIKEKVDEKYVLILYSIELDKTIKHEVDKKFYEKFNVGDTTLFYYTTYEIN